MKNVINPLAKSVLIPLGSTASASAAHVEIHKKILGSGRPLSSAPQTTTIIISNDEMEKINKIVKSLEHSGLSLNRVREKKNKNEVKKQKRGFLSMLLGTLGETLLGNILE